MFAAMLLLAQLHCAPNASGTVDCYDAQKGGAPVLKVEPNLFGGYDLRQSDGKLVRCREEGERGDRVPRRAGRASEVSVLLADWILTNSLRTAVAHSPRTPTRLPAVRIQTPWEPRNDAA